MTRRSVLLFALALILACLPTEPCACPPEFPAAGHARVEGTVLRDQPSLDPFELALHCGEKLNETFIAAVRADANGFYRFQAVVPGAPGSVADSGVVYQCRLRVILFHKNVGADTSLLVRFVPERSDVVPQIVNLRVRSNP